MEFYPNPGKKLKAIVEKDEWLRYPIKTHFIKIGESLEKIIEDYVLPFVKDSDIIVLCQKIVSLSQKRVIRKKDLKVGFWAKFLSRFAIKTPYGFSVGNPSKMQVAINLAGLPRILFACALSAFLKLFRISGIFYKVAGHQISQLDGFYGEAFPQYSDIGILGSKDNNILCDNLRKKYNLSFLIADVNDLGGHILGASQDLRGKEKIFFEILKDNPAGQSNQQTPIIIIRKNA